MILRIPIVSVLFERGQFDEQATEFVSWALLFYSLSLIGLAAIEIISRAFYAMEDTWTPVLVGMLQLGAMWLMGWWLGNVLFPLLGWIEMGGLALGYAISTLLELVLLLWLLRKKLGGINGRRVFDGVWRMLLASIIMAVVTWLVLQSLVASPKLIQLVLAGAAGASVYLIASAVFGVTELRVLWQKLSSRIRS